MKQFVILFIIILISLCCSVNRNIIGYDIDGKPIKEIKVSKRDALVSGMGMLIEFYTMKHMKSPTCAKDLILWIESMDEDSQLVYYLQYEYLKKKEKTLVFTTNTEIINSEIVKIVCMYHKKAIPRKGLVRAFVYSPTESVE